MILEEFHPFLCIDLETFPERYQSVKKRILQEYKRYGFKGDEWVLIDDDGVTIGKYEDFDGDALYNANPITDILDLKTGKIIGKKIIDDRLMQIFT